MAIIKVEKLQVPGQEMYKVDFSNEVPTLTVTCAAKAGVERFWNSVPEGNEELAKAIGNLIEDHFKANK